MLVSNNLKTIIKNFSYITIASIVVRLINFIVETYLARILGPSSYGIVTFALLSVSFFILFLNKGIEIVGTRNIARSPSSTNKEMNIFLVQRFCFTSITLVFFYLIIWLIPNSFNQDIKIITSLFGLQIILAGFSLEWLFQGLHKMQISSMSQVVGQIFYLFIIMICVKSSKDINIIPLAFNTSLLISVLLMWYFAVRYQYLNKISLSPQLLKINIWESSTIGLSVIMSTVYYSLDHILLYFWKDSETLGLYRSAYRLNVLVALVPLLIFQSMFPNLSRIEPSKKKTSYLLNYYLLFMISTGILFGAVTSIFSNELIKIIYGDKYVGAGEVLKILGVNMVIATFSYTFGQLLLCWNKQQKHLIIVSIGALVNLILNALLIPKYGMYGAAYATVAAETLVFFLFYIQVVKLAYFNKSRILISNLVGFGFALIYLKFKPLDKGATNMILFFLLFVMGNFMVNAYYNSKEKINVNQL